jgi:hypothetical protein
LPLVAGQGRFGLRRPFRRDIQAAHENLDFCVQETAPRIGRSDQGIHEPGGT